MFLKPWSEQKNFQNTSSRIWLGARVWVKVVMQVLEPNDDYLMMMSSIIKTPVKRARFPLVTEAGKAYGVDPRDCKVGDCESGAWVVMDINVDTGVDGECCCCDDDYSMERSSDWEA